MGFKGKLSKKNFFKWDYIFFFSNSDTDFYSENNNQSILFVRKSIVFLVHIIDSNSESDEEMSNTPPDIADENRNNCPVTINYVNKYLYC
jgi:hypothetical protein